VAGASPPFEGILETCLYHDPAERERIERFYSELLALPVVARWDDGLALRVASAVLLLFDRGRLAERDGPIAAHGSDGPGHACLLAPGPEYERWQERIAAAGIEITHEHRWGAERRSFYFHDPAGNLLEIADGDLWPGPPG
jgi:catechol 2,3-dioxygenase-like lactoylglutathione lyase family enzyme